MVNRWLRALLLAAVVAVQGCANSAAGSTDPDRLVIAAPADADSLDPAATLSSFDQALIELTTQQLTSIDPVHGTAAPNLARSWSVSANGLSWTFKLDPARHFADGSRVTADAVTYSFNRLVKMGKAGSQGFEAVRRVVALNPSTVRIDLTSPNPGFDRLLALASSSVVNPAVVQAHATNGDFGNAWLSEHSAGSGPYVLANWQRGQELVFDRAPGSKAWFKEVVVKVILDPSSRRIQLEKHDVDLDFALGVQEVADYAKLSGVSIAQATTPNNLIYLTLNVRRPPFNDVRVRQAVVDSIDYQGLRNQLMAGNATLLNGPIPKGFLGYDPQLPVAHRNLAAAKALLAQAGYHGDLRFTMGIGAFGPVSEFLQANMKDAGMDVTLQQLAPSAFDAVRATGDFQMIRDGITLDYPDPAIIMNLVFLTKAPANFSGYSNPVVDGLLDEALRDPNPQHRAALYQQAQRIIVHDQPVVLVISPNTVWAYSDSLAGVHINGYQPYLIHAEQMSRREKPAG